MLRKKNTKCSKVQKASCLLSSVEQLTSHVLQGQRKRWSVRQCLQRSLQGLTVGVKQINCLCFKKWFWLRRYLIDGCKKEKRFFKLMHASMANEIRRLLVPRGPWQHLFQGSDIHITIINPQDRKIFLCMLNLWYEKYSCVSSWYKSIRTVFPALKSIILYADEFDFP